MRPTAVDIEGILLFLGHENPAATTTYAKSYSAAVRTAVLKMEN